MKTMFVVVGIGALVLTACQKEEGVMLQAHDANKMMKIMHSMMARMDSLPKTSDPEIDFARMMKIHHQGAIDNSGAYLHHGNNAQLKAMAHKIIDSQVKEIMDFSDWLKSNKR